MPRTIRADRARICYHVITRGNAKAVVFHIDEDYREFMKLVARARERRPMAVLGWCLMPNHLHLVLRPLADRELGRWMHWLLTAHVQRHRVRHATIGRIWQGRYKAFPIQQDLHLLTVLRYVERNPLRASLVARAEDWPWSSLRARLEGGNEILDESPAPVPGNWTDLVNQTEDERELALIRDSAQREIPYGDSLWTEQSALDLGLPPRISGPGRPRGSGTPRLVVPGRRWPSQARRLRARVARTRSTSI